MIDGKREPLGCRCRVAQSDLLSRHSTDAWINNPDFDGDGVPNQIPIEKNEVVVRSGGHATRWTAVGAGTFRR